MTARQKLQAIAFLIIMSLPVFFEAFPAACGVALAVAGVLTYLSFRVRG